MPIDVEVVGPRGLYQVLSMCHVRLDLPVWLRQRLSGKSRALTNQVDGVIVERTKDVSTCHRLVVQPLGKLPSVAPEAIYGGLHRQVPIDEQIISEVRNEPCCRSLSATSKTIVR